MTTNRLWDVKPIDAIKGVGDLLGQVSATDRRAAEVEANKQFPDKGQLLVCLAVGKRRQFRRGSDRRIP